MKRVLLVVVAIIVLGFPLVSRQTAGRDSKVAPEPRSAPRAERREPAPVAPQPTARPVAVGADSVIADAYARRQSNLQVTGVGTVSRVLADDTSGSRHQRFVLRLASGQTLLVAHNIDIAPRVDSLTEGDTVSFYGVYEWNEKGGTLHWTHRDPSSRHVAGWLERQGRRYQ